MGFSQVAALAVASLDLELVRLLRAAMQAADAASGKYGPGISPTSAPGAAIAQRKRIEPEPEILPRKRIEPEPHFEPRKVIHPAIQVEPRIEVLPAPEAADPERPLRTPSPIEPPWKTPVWEMPVPPSAVCKVVQYRTDIPHKGSLLDLFI